MKQPKAEGLHAAVHHSVLPLLVIRKKINDRLSGT